MDFLKYEKMYFNFGNKEKNIICGVDEAGRGPLAGRVYAAAVIMPCTDMIEGINDSKKLSPKKRKFFFDLIKENAIDYSVAWSDESEIDEINILNATHLAMKRAVDNLRVKPDVILVDGNSTPDFGIFSAPIVKGDSLSYNIASASILAKVSRDEYICKEAKKYPEYFFEKHKGYGTKLHIEMIKKYGMCPLHRKTFLRKILK